MHGVIASYAQQRDKMMLTLVPPIGVEHLHRQSKDTVPLQVQMASLTDGTNYTQRTVLNASTRQMMITTTNCNNQNSWWKEISASGATPIVAISLWHLKRTNIQTAWFSAAGIRPQRSMAAHRLSTSQLDCSVSALGEF